MTRHHTLVLPATGKQVHLSTGDTLEVQLRQIGGSGSEWMVAGAPVCVSLQRDEHFGPGVNAKGAFSTRLFRFRAEGGGNGILRLALGRHDLTEPLGMVDLHLTVAG